MVFNALPSKKTQFHRIRTYTTLLFTQNTDRNTTYFRLPEKFFMSAVHTLKITSQLLQRGFKMESEWVVLCLPLTKMYTSPLP